MKRYLIRVTSALILFTIGIAALNSFSTTTIPSTKQKTLNDLKKEQQQQDITIGQGVNILNGNDDNESSIPYNCGHLRILDALSVSNDVGIIRNYGMNLKNCLGSGDLGKRLSQRKDRLHQGCLKLDAKNLERSKEWTCYSPSKTERFYYIEKSRKASVCIIPKAGSKSWIAHKAAMINNKIRAPKPIKILPVRHPFARLVSVFRDKFCDGKIFACPNGVFSESKYRSAYWIPILISSGRIPMREAMKSALHVARHTDSGTFYFREVVDNIYSLKERKLLLPKFFKRIEISFTEFLKHIVWTFEHGIANDHWLPETSLCDVCHVDYTHILHLENFDDEIPYIMNVLGYKDAKNIHSGKDESGYIKYFEDIPKELLLKIIGLFKYDFELLGYSL